MAKPLSADIRDRFRRLFEAGLSGREAARRLMISAATASRLARRLKRGASLQPAPNPRKSGRGKLAPCHDFLIELVGQDPDITLPAFARRRVAGRAGACAWGAGFDFGRGSGAQAAWLQV